MNLEKQLVTADESAARIRKELGLVSTQDMIERMGGPVRCGYRIEERPTIGNSDVIPFMPGQIQCAPIQAQQYQADKVERIRAAGAFFLYCISND